MEGCSAWISQPTRYLSCRLTNFEQFSDLNNNHDRCSTVVPLDVLPNDLLERIIALLPIGSIFRAGSVCRRWNEIVKSRRFLRNIFTQKPWYFMFTCNGIAAGYAYDPILRKWYGGIDLPCVESSNWIVSSSCGLVSFMDNDSGSKIYVCNPITKHWRQLQEPPDAKYSYYSSLSIAVNRNSHRYDVALTKSNQIPDDFLQWDFSIHVYDSGAGSWVTLAKEVFNGWRGGDESVICNGILYCLVYSAGGLVGNLEFRHALITCNLSSKTLNTSLMENSMRVPFPLTCGRLMNLNEKLILVGGIGRQDMSDVIKGIGIWELDKTEWRAVSRMPHRYFQGFGELDDVFASSGIDDLIYIQSYGSPALLIFDFNRKRWNWSQRCPVVKRFPLQLFTGFSFEPRLEVSP